MPRNGNDGARNGGRQQRRKVERWETLEVLHSGMETTAKAEIGLVIEIKQPIFEGGAKGFPKMNATVRRGDRFLRLTCFDGDVSEIKALADLLNGAVAGIDDLPEKYDVYVDKHKAGRDRGGPKKHGGVGGGLSRFSSKGEGKTERRKRKRRERGEQRP